MMRVKLRVCDLCKAAIEDDGADWTCTGDVDERHKKADMRPAEFVEAGDLERQVAALLDQLEGAAEIPTPTGPFFLEALRLAYQEAQW